MFNPTFIIISTIAVASVVALCPRTAQAADPQYAWQQVTGSAAFAVRDGAGALVYDNKMFLIGGWNPSNPTYFPKITNNEVWSSINGQAWTLVKPNTFADGVYNPATDWEGRHTAGYAVHDNKMWIIGGDANQGHYQNDVWNSTDGATWTRVTDNVPWGPRVLQYTIEFNNKIWIMGGQTLPQFAPAPETFYRDIWNTSDGVNWQQVTPNDPFWPQRGLIGGAAVMNGRMWVLGGGTYQTPNAGRSYFNDVWSTADGVNWTQHTASAPWDPREYHDVAVFDDQLWVIAGADSLGNRKDVWHSPDGVNWYELPDTPWAPRHASSVFVYDDALWFTGGMGNDVWKLTAVPEPGSAILALGAMAFLRRSRPAASPQTSSGEERKE